MRQFERAVRDAEGKLAQVSHYQSNWSSIILCWYHFQTSQPLYQSPVVEYQNLAYGIEKKDNK